MTDKNKAWNDYWQQSRNNKGGGCLPCADAAIDGALTGWWQHFASELPRKARVIDMASGNGTVLVKMLQVRPDLKATGIDAATTLPPAGKNFKLRGGISMEAMPFGDETVDSVTSQFGIEYADMAIVAGEMGRILREGGGFGLVIHNADGPIVAHNVPRLQGLRWAIEDCELLAKARNWIGQRTLLGSTIPPFFQDTVAAAVKQFGSGSVAHEFSTAVHRCLLVGQNLPARECMAMMDELGSMAENEMGRIAALVGAARSPNEIAAFCSQLDNLGLVVERQLPFSAFAPSSADLAWIVSGHKSGVIAASG